MAKNPYQGDDVDYFSGVRDEEGNVKQVGLAKSAMPEAKPKAKPKNRIVTKEELAKSGLSLRDFLNKERGLTRRGDKAPAKAPQKAAPAKEASSAPSAPSVKAGEGKTSSGMPREARGMSRIKSDMPKAKEDAYKFMSQTGKLGTMAKGGAVRKSGDGIAKRGKTKGRMV